MRDTLRVQAPPQRNPADEMRVEFARLRHERDEAVRRHRRLLRVIEFAGILAIAVMFWWAVAQ